MRGFARTALLMAALTGLFLMVGYLMGGESGMMTAFLIALGMNIFAYWNSDKIALRLQGARAVDEASAPQLVRLVGTLAENAGLPMPRVFLIDTPQPNAFATGRNPEHAAVAVTTGLMNELSSEELAGVIAHELSHVKHRDTLIMTVTATLAGAIFMLANFAFFLGGHRGNNNPLGAIGAILMMILAPLAAMLVQMAISRGREFQADAEGAAICGRPLWLAAALAKIENASCKSINQPAESNPASAHMFIINPLHGRAMDSLFSTHPSTAERIRRLQAMNDGAAANAQTPRPWG